jgi:hypothetical protein
MASGLESTETSGPQFHSSTLHRDMVVHMLWFHNMSLLLAFTYVKTSLRMLYILLTNETCAPSSICAFSFAVTLAFMITLLQYHCSSYIALGEGGIGENFDDVIPLHEVVKVSIFLDIQTQQCRLIPKDYHARKHFRKKILDDLLHM